jgi:uncharacterized protein
MNKTQKTALVLVVIGALNWGLVGIFSFDLVAVLFGSLSLVTRAVYTIICLAGLYSLTIFSLEREHHRIDEHDVEEHKIVRHDEVDHKTLHRA